LARVAAVGLGKWFEAGMWVELGVCRSSRGGAQQQWVAAGWQWKALV
jgi:hypothetical protein